MKKFRKPLQAILCVVLTLVFIAAIPAVMAASDGSYVLGDADNSGDVDIIDATLIMRVCADMVKDTDGLIASRCDIDGNGFDITAATWIQRWLAEMNVPYPIGQRVNLPTEPPTQKPTQKPTQRSTDYELPIV